MLTLFNSADLIFSTFLIFSLLSGAGIWLWALLSPRGRFGIFYEFVGILASGMIVSVLIGWICGMMGTFSRPASLIFLFISFYLLFQYRAFIRECFRAGKKFSNKQEIFTDSLILILLLPVSIFAFLSPMINVGDSFYTFHVWTQHWGARNDLSYYNFGSYSSFLPILSSYIYKLRDSAATILPNERYLLNLLSPFLCFLALAVISRALRLVRRGRAALFLSIFGTVLLIKQNDFQTLLYAFRPDSLLVFFSSLVIFEIVAYSRSQLLGTPDKQRFLVFLVGLSLVEGTGLVMAILFALVRAGIIKKQDQVSLYQGRRFIGIVRSLFISLATIAIINAPYRIQQNHLNQVEHFRAYSDHTFSPMTSTLSAQLDVFKQIFTNGFDPLKQEARRAFYKAKEISSSLDKFGEGQSAYEIPVTKWLLPFILLGLALSVFELTQLGLLIAFGCYCFWWWFASGRTPWSNSLHLTMEWILLFFIVGSSLLKFYGLLSSTKKFRLGKYFYLGIFPASLLLLYLSSMTLSTIWQSHLKEAIAKGFFGSQKTRERLDAYFPGGADAISFVLKLYGEQIEPENWRKMLISADHPWDRLIPNSFNPVHPHSPKNEEIYDLFTHVKTRDFPGAIQIGRLWVAPARRLFKVAKVELSAIVLSSKGSRGLGGDPKGFYFLIEKPSSETEQFKMLADASIVTDESWSYSLESGATCPSSKVGLNIDRIAVVKHPYGDGAYGQEGWNPGVIREGIQGSLGSWVGLNSDDEVTLKSCGEMTAVYKKKIKLSEKKIGDVYYTSFQTGKAEILVNGVKIASRTLHTYLFEKISYKFKPDDVVQIRVSGPDQMLFAEIDWRSHHPKYLGSQKYGPNDFHYFYVPFETNQAEIQNAGYSTRLEIPSELLSGAISVRYLPISYLNVDQDSLDD